jgi:hypothetical protein
MANKNLPDALFANVVSRRGFLAAGPTVLASGTASAVDSGPTGTQYTPIAADFLDFPNAAARFRAHFRFERDLRDEGQSLSWYHFTQYAVVAGQRPVAVVRYEGMEYSYFRRIGDLTWRIHAHNLSFPREIVRGAFTDEVVNPITGQPVKPPTIQLLEDPGVLHAPRGYLPLDSRDGKWLESYLLFRVEGELVKVDHVRPTPDAWPLQFIESSTSSVPKREFDNSRITSLKYQTSGFYIFPWPAWMAMGELVGHMLGAWSGRKLSSPRQLPNEFRRRAEHQHAALLAPRWAEFDRPLSATVRAALG